VSDGGFRGDDLLFRTRTGGRPSWSNWTRALERALGGVGAPSMGVYDCRHAAATTWLHAGVMDHSVETLVATYVGALDGDEQLANERIECVLG
jgi:integrase